MTDNQKLLDAVERYKTAKAAHAEASESCRAADRELHRLQRLCSEREKEERNARDEMMDEIHRTGGAP